MARRDSKKHLYNVADVMFDLDRDEKGIINHSFFCLNKSEAFMCRNNIQSVISKGGLKHKYKTETINAINGDDKIFWFCVVTKCILKEGTKV